MLNAEEEQSISHACCHKVQQTAIPNRASFSKTSCAPPEVQEVQYVWSDPNGGKVFQKLLRTIWTGLACKTCSIIGCSDFPGTHWDMLYVM